MKRLLGLFLALLLTCPPVTAGSLPTVGAGPSAGAFLPTQISGLVLWLRADGITGLNDADPVTTWSDESGNSNDVTQSTAAKKPVYKTSIVNGQPVVRFDGTDDYMDVVGVSGLTAATFFMVYKAVTNDSGDGYGHFGSESANNHYSFTDGNIYDGFGSAVRRNTGNPTVVLSTWHIYAISVAANQWTSWINGTQHFTTAINTVGWDPDPVIGTGNDVYPPISTFGAADFAELMIYDSVLSVDDRSSVHTYLGDKYGIIISSLWNPELYERIAAKGKVLPFRKPEAPEIEWKEAA